MNINNPTELYLYQAKITKEEITNQQAELDAKQREIEVQLKSVNKYIEHWTFVLAMEREPNNQPNYKHTHTL